MTSYHTYDDPVTYATSASCAFKNRKGFISGKAYILILFAHVFVTTSTIWQYLLRVFLYHQSIDTHLQTSIGDMFRSHEGCMGRTWFVGWKKNAMKTYNC